MLWLGYTFFCITWFRTEMDSIVQSPLGGRLQHNWPSHTYFAILACWTQFCLQFLYSHGEELVPGVRKAKVKSFNNHFFVSQSVYLLSALSSVSSLNHPSISIVSLSPNFLRFKSLEPSVSLLFI